VDAGCFEDTRERETKRMACREVVCIRREGKSET
jgi:hypothetical protein